MKFLILTLFLGFSALAGITENQVIIKTTGDKITITTKPGFHLNAEAPASAVFDDLEALFKPTTKTEKLFAFNKLKKTKAVQLSFYVCDDKKTVCELHKKNVDLVSGNEAVVKEKKSTFNSAKDLNLKSANGNPTLLVFSAPWCPACVRMQTETYHKPEVEKQLGKVNFVKLNSDLAENYELSEKFKIKAIPTLILLDKNGMETYRWLDYQPAKVFAKTLEEELKKVNQAEAVMKNAQLGDPAAAHVLAMRAFNTLDYAEAFKWFSLTKSPEDQKFKLASEVSLSQERAEADEKLNEDHLQTLQKAISLTKSKLDQMRWTIDLFEKKNETKTFTSEARTKAEALLSDLDRLINNTAEADKIFKESTYGEYGGFEKPELLNMKARLYTILDQKDEKKKNDEASIAFLLKKDLSVNRPGEMLLAIAYLREAGEIKKVESFYQALTKKYNTSYVYFEKYARFMQKNKQYEKALALVSEALKYPEGNMPQLSLLKSQILKDLDKKSEAIALIDEALKDQDIQHKKFKKVVKKLNDLKEEISKAK